MAHPAPFNAEPIRLTASQSPCEARNLLIREVLELNFMPFPKDPPFPNVVTPIVNIIDHVFADGGDLGVVLDPHAAEVILTRGDAPP
jgi:hypothetical protein